MPNKDLFQARSSIKYDESLASVLDSVQQMQNSPKHLPKLNRCKLFKVNSNDNGDTISISGEKVEIKTSFRYLGDIFNSHGENSDLCEERARKTIATRIEIIVLCKEINFGKSQFSNMLFLYH